MDGNNVFEVYRVCKYALEKARSGKGPILIESKTMRMKGHAEHDDASYVPKALFDEWKKKDPILRCEKELLTKKVISDSENEALKVRVSEEMEQAETFALNAPLPDAADAQTGVYAD